MQAIKTVGLVKRYKNITAVDKLDLEIRDGELFSLLGVNGAGKTTILHTITGLITPKAGKITFEGHDLLKTPAHKILSLHQSAKALQKGRLCRTRKASNQIPLSCYPNVQAPSEGRILL